MQDGINRDKHRQLGLVDVVVSPGKRAKGNALDRDKAILVKKGEFFRGQRIALEDALKVLGLLVVIPIGGWQTLCDWRRIMEEECFTLLQIGVSYFATPA